MSCYTIVHVNVTNMDGFKEYSRQVPATLEKYGGTYLVRGGEATDIEGKMPGDRHVVVRWSNREAFETWYHSPEYQAILPLRLENSTGVLTVVDGYAP